MWKRLKNPSIFCFEAFCGIIIVVVVVIRSTAKRYFVLNVVIYYYYIFIIHIFLVFIYLCLFVITIIIYMAKDAVQLLKLSVSRVQRVGGLSDYFASRSVRQIAKVSESTFNRS